MLSTAQLSGIYAAYVLRSLSSVSQATLPFKAAIFKPFLRLSFLWPPAVCNVLAMTPLQPRTSYGYQE